MKSLTTNQASILDTAAAKYAKADLVTEQNLDALVKAIKDAGITDAKACAPKLMQHIAAARGIELVEKDRGTGKTWPATAQYLAGAKSALSRALKAIKGEAHTPQEVLTVPADIQALLNKAWKLCGDYEQAGKLMATAVANAKAAK